MRKDPKPLDETLNALSRLKQPRGQESHGMQPRNPTPIRKRVSGAAFMNGQNTGKWLTDGTVITPNALGAQLYYATLDFPAGSRITQIKARWRKTNAGDTVQLDLQSISDTAALTTHRSLTPAALGTNIDQGLINPNVLVVDAAAYYFQLALTSTVAGTDTALYWAEVQYLPPTI